MAGDHGAFSELARASIGRLYAAARLILRDDQRAEDATQEALVAAWRDSPPCATRIASTAWLLPPARRALADKEARRRRAATSAGSRSAIARRVRRPRRRPGPRFIRGTNGDPAHAMGRPGGSRLGSAGPIQLGTAPFASDPGLAPECVAPRSDWHGRDARPERPIGAFLDEGRTDCASGPTTTVADRASTVRVAARSSRPSEGAAHAAPFAGTGRVRWPQRRLPASGRRTGSNLTRLELDAGFETTRTTPGKLRPTTSSPGVVARRADAPVPHPRAGPQLAGRPRLPHPRRGHRPSTGP